MAIQFDQIPVTLRTPGVFVEFDSSRAVPGLQVEAYHALLTGAFDPAGGAVAALTPTRINSEDEARAAFGAGSPLSEAYRYWRMNNQFTETWACGIDTSGGTARVVTLTFGGAPTEAGTVALYIGGQRVTFDVASGAALADIAQDCDDAIDEQLPDCPFTPLAAGVLCTLTAKVKGIDANAIPIVHSFYTGEALPAGLTLAIATPTPGVGALTYSDVITAIGDDRYHVILFPQLASADYTALETELTSRWGPIKQNDGHAFGALADTVANLTTAGGLRNSPHVTVIGHETAVQNSPNDVAAAAAAQVAAKGNDDPARPFQTLALVGILAAPRVDRFTIEERDTLLHNGISTIYVDEGDTVRIERLISTYQTNALGAPDTAYLNVNTLLTLSLLRSTFRTRFSTKFGRVKLIGDDAQVGAGAAVITPSRARAECVAIFRDWEAAGLVENVSQFKADLVVERDANDADVLNVLLPPDLANQLRRLGVKLQFRLNS